MMMLRVSTGDADDRVWLSDAGGIPDAEGRKRAPAKIVLGSVVLGVLLVLLFVFLLRLSGWL
jgi:hypothetical protein